MTVKSNNEMEQVLIEVIQKWRYKLHIKVHACMGMRIIHFFFSNLRFTKLKTNETTFLTGTSKDNKLKNKSWH